MINPIATLIETLLDEHRDAHTFLSNPDLSGIIANALTVASWQQLADVTGAQLETDYDGQLVLYTGSYIAQSDHEIIHARDLTPEEEAAEASAESEDGQNA
jgi:hypothetical protein